MGWASPRLVGMLVYACLLLTGGILTIDKDLYFLLFFSNRAVLNCTFSTHYSKAVPLLSDQMVAIRTLDKEFN